MESRDIKSFMEKNQLNVEVYSATMFQLASPDKNGQRSREVSQESLTEEQLIEYEQALMALAQNPKIQNPCMKRTMLVGPKKFVGSVENPQIHQYTSKKITFTEFDTLSLVPSAKTTSQMTAPGSSKYGGFRSNESSSAMKRPRPTNEYGSSLNADMPGKPLDA